MLKAQLLILFLIFYVQNSSSFDLTTRDLVKEAMKLLKQIQKIDTAHSSGVRISDLINKNDSSEISVDAVFERMILWRAALEYKELIHWDELCNAEWRTYLTLNSYSSNLLKWNHPKNHQESDRLVSSSECLETHMAILRLTIHRAFSELTNKALIQNKGCIGITTIQSIHHLYIWAVNFEIDAAIKRTATRADRSSVNHVAQPSTPDYSIELKNEYLSYTEILISSFESMRSRFSPECKNETTNYFKAGSAIELTGFLRQTIFKYDANKCGHFSRSCNSISDPKYTNRCRKTWITKGAIRPYDYSNCRYSAAIGTCLMEDEETYPYVNSTKLGFKGREKNCSRPGDQLIEVSSSSQFRTCSCNSVSNKWRVHVGMIKSDTKNNYVIVGVRFQVVAHILTLEAAEGKLMSLGYVTDFSWIPLVNMRSNSVELTKENARFFSEMLSFRKSSIVLTGIRLGLTHGRTNRILSGFEVHIYGHPFNPESGILSLSKQVGESNWLNCGVRNSLNELDFTLVRPPANVEPRMATKQSFCNYINLKQSTLDSDFGQSTLPLFYTSPNSKLMYSLNVINLYWRGMDDHSGFIVLGAYANFILHSFENYVDLLKEKGKII